MTRRTKEAFLPLLDLNELYGIVGIDRKGLIVYWNKAAELITHFKPEEAIGQNACLFFTPTDQEQKVHEKEMKQALAVGRAEDERWHVKKGGERFWAVGALIAIRDENEDVEVFCKIFRDNTARKHTEEEILRTNLELNRFAYTAAHDLQQPIRTVTSYLQLALKERGAMIDVKSKEYLQIALDASIRMRKLTADLLALAQGGSQREMEELVDTNAACDLAVENLRIVIEETDAFVHRGSLPQVKGVPTQIGQVFQNLIGNALKYRHPNRKPVVFIDAEKTGRHWQFSVRDNGIGIDLKDNEKIFGAFERLNGGKTTGSGLGLTIVKKVVEAHGGTVWLRSTPNEGTTFYFTVPE